jgi:hypothetical protein
LVVAKPYPPVLAANWLRRGTDAAAGKSTLRPGLGRKYTGGVSQAIIITGMHRSGTSLVSSLLQHAGVHVGERLIAANAANPCGYFEDVDFYEFHEELLHSRGQTYLYLASDFSFEPTLIESARAAELVKDRAGRSVWGWKDPRTSLFLPFWDQHLSDARFVFVYRHPLAVLLSLLRRGEFNSFPGLLAGLNAWQLYNTKIQQFYDAHGERCILAPIEGLVGQFELFAQRLTQKLAINVRLDPAAFDRVYRSQELRPSQFSQEVVAIFAAISPMQLTLMDQLNDRADLRAGAGKFGEPESPYLAALADFVTVQSRPFSSAMKQGLLQLLVTLLAPVPAEEMLGQIHENAQVAQRRLEQLWLYAQQLERRCNEQMEQLEAERVMTEEQNAEIESQSHELWERQRDLAAHAARVESLMAELEQIYESRAWKMIQAYSTFKGKWQRKVS